MRHDEFTAEQEELLAGQMLRHQVGIDPDRVGAVLDMAAVGLVNGAWRNSPVEDWHAGHCPLSDGDMLRINSHTTHRVRDMVRRWRTGCGIDAHALTAELDTIDIDAVEWLLRDLYRWFTDPKRKLPIGLTLADIAGDELDQFADHVAESLGAVVVLAEERGNRFAFTRAAAHGGLACRHWWGTPAWPQLVNRFTTAVDDAADPHWGQNGQWFASLPTRPAQITDSDSLRRLLLRHPWKLDTASANYIVTAGIGYMRDSVPPLPTLATPYDH
ncbi:hypothetical protein [Lentzea kentuckyensis]|uniref:hypothetical protein n=1 Tax=Lentzea kentuckyensis TaxID=360086 RepID=UPI00117BBE6F|nr:hypothetical protein [Lentzea kentuckyensis]